MSDLLVFLDQLMHSKVSSVSSLAKNAEKDEFLWEKSSINDKIVVHHVLKHIFYLIEAHLTKKIKVNWFENANNSN